MFLNELKGSQDELENKLKYPRLNDEFVKRSLKDKALTREFYALSLIIQGLIIDRLVADSLITDQLEFSKDPQDLKAGEICLSTKFREIWDAQNETNILQIFSSGTDLEQTACIDKIYDELALVIRSN